MIRLGFTGTHHGMTDQQMKSFRRLIKRLEILEFHHGDCIGADKESHIIMREEWPKVPITGHPPSNNKARAFCDFDIIVSAKPYLVRDRIIVESVDEMIATPRGFNEQLRSGTWTTIRYARKAHTLMHIIWPDGRIKV